MKELNVTPSDIRQGVQITVNAGAHKPAKGLVVTPINIAGLDTFVVPLSLFDRQYLAQFTIDVPGDYQLSLGKSTKIIHVHPHEDLSFALEFGLTATLVVFSLIGVLLWNKNKRKLPY